MLRARMGGVVIAAGRAGLDAGQLAQNLAHRQTAKCLDLLATHHGLLFGGQAAILKGIVAARSDGHRFRALPSLGSDSPVGRNLHRTAGGMDGSVTKAMRVRPTRWASARMRASAS